MRKRESNPASVIDGANNSQLVGLMDFEAGGPFEFRIAVTIHEIDWPANHANGREWL
jgi:hypothetical protein